MQKLDDVDRKILDILIDNTRTPFTDIAKRLLISPGTVHVRVKKMEDLGIIKGSSLTLDYKMLSYNFIAYVGVLIDRSRRTYEIIEELKKKPYITVAHITTGKYNIFCKMGIIVTNSIQTFKDGVLVKIKIVNFGMNLTLGRIAKHKALKDIWTESYFGVSLILV